MLRSCHLHVFLFIFHLVVRLQCCFGATHHRVYDMPLCVRVCMCVRVIERASESVCSWISSTKFCIHFILITTKNWFIYEWFVCDMAYRRHIFNPLSSLLPIYTLNAMYKLMVMHFLFEQLNWILWNSTK